jgi:hypothetical protein
MYLGTPISQHLLPWNGDAHFAGLLVRLQIPRNTSPDLDKHSGPGALEAEHDYCPAPPDELLLVVAAGSAEHEPVAHLPR